MPDTTSEILGRNGMARRTALGGIPFYFVMSHVAMAIGLVKGLFNLQRVTWKKADRTGDSAAVVAGGLLPTESPVSSA